MRLVRLSRAQVHQGPLILVNCTHPLRTEHGDLTAVDERYPNILVDRQAVRLLSACIRSVGGESGIVPVSGWRSYDEQQQIWDDSLAENGMEFTSRYVARPGCSEHQTGLAIDLGKAAKHIDFIRPDFPDDGVCGRFRKAAARYGFIQRYTADKDQITGIGCEPWHFRYVGAPHARLMTENGLCLEEYAAFLRSAPEHKVVEHGRISRVFFAPCAGEHTDLILPDQCCQVSGDNADGFIVTVWETEV